MCESCLAAIDLKAVQADLIIQTSVVQSLSDMTSKKWCTFPVIPQIACQSAAFAVQVQALQQQKRGKAGAVPGPKCRCTKGSTLNVNKTGKMLSLCQVSGHSNSTT
jgi:hypothetical protein